MFTYPDNFFFRQYLFLANRLQNNPDSDDYQERHHVFPVSIFGKNKTIIRMNYKHHIIMHYLLWRGYQTEFGNYDNRTISASRAVFSMFSFKSDKRTMKVAFRKIAEDATIGMKMLFSEEHRKHISDSLKGRPLSEKWIGARMGHEVSPETRKKISEANMGRISPMEGKHHSEETKKKISEKKKGIKVSEETKEKLRARPHPKTLSQDRKNKIADSVRISWDHRDRKLTEEQKKKISESVRKSWIARKRVDPPPDHSSEKED